MPKTARKRKNVSADDPSLIWSAKEGSIEDVRYLLRETNADPKEGDNAALLLAAEYGHLDVVKELLRALPDNDPERDSTAFERAAWGGALNVVTFLARRPGVDPFAKHALALYCAIEEGHVEVMEFICTLKGMYNDSLHPRRLRRCAENFRADRFYNLYEIENYKGDSAELAALCVKKLQHGKRFEECLQGIFLWMR